MFLFLDFLAENMTMNSTYSFYKPSLLPPENQKALGIFRVLFYLHIEICSKIFGN